MRVIVNRFKVYDIARQAGVLGWCAFIVAPGKFHDGFYDADYPPTKTAGAMLAAIRAAGHEVREIDGREDWPADIE